MVKRFHLWVGPNWEGRLGLRFYVGAFESLEAAQQAAGEPDQDDKDSAEIAWMEDDGTLKMIMMGDYPWPEYHSRKVGWMPCWKWSRP